MGIFYPILMLVFSILTKFGEPTWFSCMENAMSACYHNDFAKSDEWLDKGMQDAKKYNMNPPYYYGLYPSQGNLPGKLCELANLYATKKHHDKAESLCKEANAISSPPGGYRRALAIIYEDEGKYVQVEKILLELLKETEKSPIKGNSQHELWQPLTDLADYYVTVGKLSKAEELYTKALKLTRENSADTDLTYQKMKLGKVRLQQGKIEKARTLFEQVLSINERARYPIRSVTCDALSNLADGYAAEHNYAKAKSLYIEALDKPLDAHPLPRQGEVDCHHHYAALLRHINRLPESKAMEESACKLQKALNSKSKVAKVYSLPNTF